MKLQKIILCVAAGLTAFGAGVGLFEIGRWCAAAFAPLKIEIRKPELLSAPVVYPQNIPDFKLPADTPPAEETAAAEEPEDWGENGYYYIIGDNPKGFEDFAHLELTTHEWDGKTEKPVAVKPRGELWTEEKEFQLSWLNLAGRRISLITRERKGVSYQFDGKFIEAEAVSYKNENGEENYDDAFLKGRLTKWRNGKKIAEANVKFGIHHGC